MSQPIEVAMIVCLLITVLGVTGCQGDEPKEAAEAPAPEWISTLLPHTGKPDRLQHRLSRVSATEIAMGTQTGGSAVAEMVFPGLDGKPDTCRVRLFLPPTLRENPKRQLPLIYNAGYDLDEPTGLALAGRGQVVATSYGHPLNPLARAVTMDNAILHALRQLPFIDPGRVAVQGGSAGGYMTLMVSADAFPLVYARPDVPPIHWGYNGDYIHRHQEMAGPSDSSAPPRMPVLQIVGGITSQCLETFGIPFDHPAYVAMSPIAHLDTLTAPILAPFSTADILVPIDQVGKQLVRPIDPSLFPAGFSTAMTDRVPAWNGHRTLLEALPTSQYELFVIPLPDDMPRVPQGETPPEGMKPIVMPFSKDKTWSIVVVDEGPTVPTAGHLRYVWGWDADAFRQWAEERGVTPDQLTLPKLTRLMMRIQGKPWRPARVKPKGYDHEIDACLLDWPEAERADVLTGLRAFARQDACALRLGEVYNALPQELRLLGPTLGSGTADSVRKALNAVK